MKKIFKGKAGTAVILVFTLILAGIAIFTAVRLYQLRQQPVAPNVPSSFPKAQEATPTPNPACSISFTIGATPTATPSGTPTATPSGTPSGTPTATPTATPNPSGTPNTCGGTCGSNSNCVSDKICYQGFCRNPACVTSQNCVCAPTSPPGSTPTGTPTATPPTLPQSGTSWPTILGAGMGTLIILGAILLAL